MALIAKPVLNDSIEIKPGDSPAIIRLKKLGMIDSTELENFQKELKAEKEAQMIINVELKVNKISKIPITQQVNDDKDSTRQGKNQLQRRK